MGLKPDFQLMEYELGLEETKEYESEFAKENLKIMREEFLNN